MLTYFLYLVADGTTQPPSPAGIGIGDPSLWGQLGGLNGLIIFAFLVGFSIFLKMTFDHMKKDAEAKNAIIQQTVETNLKERDTWLDKVEKLHEQHATALRDMNNDTIAAMREHTAAINALKTEISLRSQR